MNAIERAFDTPDPNASSTHPEHKFIHIMFRKILQQFEVERLRSKLVFSQSVLPHLGLNLNKIRNEIRLLT